MQTFYRWLQNFTSEDTSIGDLARAVSIDYDRPRVNTLETWEQHLISASASSSVIETLQEAWQWYIADKANSQTNKSHRYCPSNDERWIIKRPLLPRYLEFMPTLPIRVCIFPKNIIGGHYIGSGYIHLLVGRVT